MARTRSAAAQDDGWRGIYAKWRHGGWYVRNVRYPSGACGCVSNNFTDRRWRIVCYIGKAADEPTFATREEAARAERDLVLALHAQTT